MKATGNMILVLCLLVLAVGLPVTLTKCERCIEKYNPERTDTVRVTEVRTVVRVDTLYIVRPLPYAVYVETADTVRLDSCVHVREVAEYGDSTYHAIVSGVRPRLDEITVYPRTVYRTEYVTATVKERRKRLGLGLQAGYGFPHGAYAGVGVSYNIFSW